MRAVSRFFNRILPQINFILALVLLVLFVTDRFNRAMSFLANEYTKWILFAFCLTVILQSLLAIMRSCRRRPKK